MIKSSILTYSILMMNKPYRLYKKMHSDSYERITRRATMGLPRLTNVNASKFHPRTLSKKKFKDKMKLMLRKYYWDSAAEGI